MKYEALCSLSISRGIRPLIGASFYIKDTNIIESYLFTDSWPLNLLKNVLDVYEIIKIIIPEDMSMLEKRLDTIIECDLERIERMFFSPQIDFIPNFQPDNFFIKSSIFSLIMVYNISNYSIKLKIHPRRMFISQESISDLDLVDKKISLYKIIKNTNTKMGERLLKDNIMQPLINLEEIEERHQLLLFLQENKSVKNNINTVLNTFIDIDQFLQDVENTYNDCNNKIKYLTSILKHKALLSDIDEIFNILKDIKNIKIINEVKEAIINVKSIYENISSSSEETNITTINNDTTDIFNLIPTGINEHLDLLLNIREENIEDIKDIINELEILKEIKIEIIYDSMKLQYILKIKEKDFFNNFINKNENNGNNDTYKNMINTNSTYTNAISISPFIPEIVFYSNKRKYVYFSTIDINKINHRITEAEEKIVILIYEYLKDYFSNIDYSVFYILADKIALLDIIISFLSFGKKYDCCLPKILDNKKTCSNDEDNKRVNVNDLIFVENTYNLLLEDNYVKNCIYSSSLLNFTLITGNNMSGKTTYMKNIANIIILSQIGSPINAKSATLRLFDSILTRSSHNNHISCSTFKKELIDIKFMLEFDNSLLLIDEFGRSSGFTESIDLCYKICKRLIRGKTNDNKYFIEDEIDDKTIIESSDIPDQNIIKKEEVITCNQTVDVNIRTINSQKNNHVFFVTHFRELLSLLSKYKNVNVINSNNFKVTSGISKDIDGIKLIENILNYNVIEESRRIRKILFKEEDIKYYDRTIIQYGMELEKDKNFNIKKHLNRE